MRGFKSSVVRQIEVELGGAVKVFVAKLAYECVRASMCMSFAEASATQLTCTILLQQTDKKTLICFVHLKGLWWWCEVVKSEVSLVFRGIAAFYNTDRFTESWLTNCSLDVEDHSLYCDTLSSVHLSLRREMLLSNPHFVMIHTESCSVSWFHNAFICQQQQMNKIVIH